MGYETINVTPVTPRIGANVEGIALAKPLSNRQVEELHQALADHQVLFFRDQQLDGKPTSGSVGISVNCIFTPARPGRKGIRRFCRSMRTPIPGASPGSTGTRSLLRRGAADGQHPLLHTVPDCGGEYAVRQPVRGLRRAFPRMKAYLEGLTATHSGDHVYRRNNALMGLAESGKVYPKARHPVVRTHPATKRKALYVNGDFTTHIDGLPRDEGRAVPRLPVRVQHTRGIPGAVSAGGPIRSPSGTTAASSTRPSGTISRRRAPAAA